MVGPLVAPIITDLFPVYRQGFFIVFFIYYTMYTLQYWNEGAAEWRGAGCSSTSREVVARRLRGARTECRDLVRFRIEHLPSLPIIP